MGIEPTTITTLQCDFSIQWNPSIAATIGEWGLAYIEGWPYLRGFYHKSIFAIWVCIVLFPHRKICFHTHGFRSYFMYAVYKLVLNLIWSHWCIYLCVCTYSVHLRTASVLVFSACAKLRANDQRLTGLYCDVTQLFQFWQYCFQVEWHSQCSVKINKECYAVCAWVMVLMGSGFM